MTAGPRKIDESKITLGRIRPIFSIVFSAGSIYFGLSVLFAPYFLRESITVFLKYHWWSVLWLLAIPGGIYFPAVGLALLLNLFSGGVMLYEKDGRLIFLSPFFLAIPICEITGCEIKNLPYGSNIKVYRRIGKGRLIWATFITGDPELTRQKVLHHVNLKQIDI